MDINILSNLVDIYSPTGQENLMCEYLKGIQLRHFGGFELVSDMGNCLTYYKNNVKDKTILIDAHIDEICSKVINITKDGFLIANSIGCSNDKLLGKPAIIMSSVTDSVINANYIPGVPHMKWQRNKYANKYNSKLLYVDIGAKSREEANRLVEIGDPILADVHMRYLTQNIVTGRGLDNKVGIYVLLNLMKYFNTKQSGSKYNLIFNFSGKEEVGKMPYLHFKELPNIQIDSVVVVDTGIATDTPQLKNGLYGDIRLGKGSIISRGEDCYGMYKSIRNLSKDKNIPIQINYPTGGGTNLKHFSKYNVYTQTICVPCRNLHSPVESVDINDIRSTIELIKQYILK